MQFQADVLGVEVRRPVVAETTALGAAYLAGLAAGVWHDLADLAGHWTLDRAFVPQMTAEARHAFVRRWAEAVKRARNWVVP
jgi:glycerol kinase